MRDLLKLRVLTPVRFIRMMLNRQPSVRLFNLLQRRIRPNPQRIIVRHRLNIWNKFKTDIRFGFFFSIFIACCVGSLIKLTMDISVPTGCDDGTEQILESLFEAELFPLVEQVGLG